MSTDRIPIVGETWTHYGDPRFIEVELADPTAYVIRFPDGDRGIYSLKYVQQNYTPPKERLPEWVCGLMLEAVR